MTDENDSTTPPDRVTRSWQAARGASWPADWDGQPPPLRSGDASLVWVGKSSTSGKRQGRMLAHFTNNGSRRYIHLSGWRKAAKRKRTPHGCRERQ